jgi:hypothetical protein
MKTAMLAAAMLGALWVSIDRAAAQSGTREDFQAFAINMSNISTGAASSVDIVIERWSTDAERDALVTAFKTRQQNGLLSALQHINPRVGYIRLPNTLGYDLRYARQVPDEEGGRRILLGTDRRIGSVEARNQPRTMNYPFTIIELRLDSRNEGVGKMAVATMITWNKEKNVIELENYASEPVRLNNVRRRSPSN